MVRVRGENRQDVAHRHQAAIEGVVERMRDHVNEPLRLAEMAASISLSTFHFDRVFRDVTGVSAGAFQAALRIDAAKRLLLGSDESITEICLELGFESIGSFTSRFSLAVGIPPTAFRAYAAWLRTQDVAGLLAPAFAAHTNASELRGTIDGTPSDDAFVWIGMFPKGLPSAHPASGTLRRGDGAFALATPPDGQYRILAAALAPACDWYHYFAFGDHMRVATHGMCRIEGGALVDAAQPLLTLRLRPPRRSDPPILILLPLLAVDEPSRLRSTDPSGSHR